MRISIGLCTYNGGTHLAEQLLSIAKQTRQPDELVVFDDASTDSTPTILQSFAASSRFPVSISINPQQLGVSQNFGHAISACTGDVVAFCDQDDVWLPEKLRRIEQAFAGNDDLGFVFS